MIAASAIPFMHRDQPVGRAYDRDDRRLGTKTVTVDQKLNLVGSEIAKAAGGNLLASQVVDRGDIRAGEKQVLQLHRSEKNHFGGAPRAVAVAIVLGIVV
jgi:hypothetical protein